MKMNPITTIIGILVALCPVIGAIFPDAKEFCDVAINELIGLGFIASADGIKSVKFPHLSGGIKALGAGIILMVSLSSCAEVKQALRDFILEPEKAPVVCLEDESTPEKECE